MTARKPGKPEDRAIQVGLTRRQAEYLMAACRAAIRKATRARAKEPEFVPEPGKGDANLAKISTLTQIYEEVYARYRAEIGLPDDAPDPYLPGREF